MSSSSGSAAFGRPRVRATGALFFVAAALGLLATLPLLGLALAATFGWRPTFFSVAVALRVVTGPFLLPLRTALTFGASAFGAALAFAAGLLPFDFPETNSRVAYGRVLPFSKKTM